MAMDARARWQDATRTVLKLAGDWLLIAAAACGRGADVLREDSGVLTAAGVPGLAGSGGGPPGCPSDVVAPAGVPTDPARSTGIGGGGRCE